MLKNMFANLNWTFPKEPVLWMAFIAAILNAAVQAIQGDVTWLVAVETVVGLFLAFVARGASTPTADPKILNSAGKTVPLSPVGQ
jgi:hypothetical protein